MVGTIVSSSELVCSKSLWRASPRARARAAAGFGISSLQQLRLPFRRARVTSNSRTSSLANAGSPSETRPWPLRRFQAPALSTRSYPPSTASRASYECMRSPTPRRSTLLIATQPAITCGASAPSTRWKSDGVVKNSGRRLGYERPDRGHGCSHYLQQKGRRMNSRVRLEGSARTPVPGSTIVGKTDASIPVDVSVIFKRKQSID